MRQNFDKAYYEERDQLEDSGHYFTIGERISQLFRGPILDVGCGMNWVVKHLTARGHMEARGIDISTFAEEHHDTNTFIHGDFESVEETFNVILANQLLQSLTDGELKRFAFWVREHMGRYLVVFNASDSGEYDRSTEDYLKLFEGYGLILEEPTNKKLHEGTDWDALVLTKRKGIRDYALHKAMLSSDCITLSLIVDCWSGKEYLQPFFQMLESLVLPRTELILVNPPSGLEEFLSHNSEHNTEFIVTRTGVEVIVVEEQQSRSTAVVFIEGIKHAKGAVVSLIRLPEIVNSSFFISAIESLLGNSEASFVTSAAFLKITDTERQPWRLDSLNIQILSKFSSNQQCLQLEPGLLYQSSNFKLSDMINTENIPSVFVCRTKDLFEAAIDSTQEVFCEKDILLDLTYKGREGIKNFDMFFITCDEQNRFAPSEKEEGKQRLVNNFRVS